MFCYYAELQAINWSVFCKGSPPYIFASMRRDHQDGRKTMSRTQKNISDRKILACSHNFCRTFSGLKYVVVYQKWQISDLSSRAAKIFFRQRVQWLKSPRAVGHTGWFFNCLSQILRDIWYLELFWISNISCSTRTRDQGCMSAFFYSLWVIGICLQMALARKDTVSLIAFLRLFSGVRSHVHPQIAWVELIATNRTLLFDPQMCSSIASRMLFFLVYF